MSAYELDALYFGIGLASVFLIIKFGGRKMLDVNALLKEVDSEVEKESREKAKGQLKAIQRDINNAKQVLANLERKRADLLVSISEGTN